MRDNLAMVPEEIVHRGFHYAIVDEADYLLIDEARTPLIISGPAYEDKSFFRRVDQVVRHLVEGKHYEVENKTHSVSMTEDGFDKVEKGLGVENLSSPKHLQIYHAVHHSLLAHGLYKRDVEYIIDKGKVIIVDEFTGRTSEDKRYADGQDARVIPGQASSLSRWMMISGKNSENPRLKRHVPFSRNSVILQANQSNPGT